MPMLILELVGLTASRLRDQSFWSEEQYLRCCQTKLLANHQHQQSRDRVGLWYLGESQGCGTKPALQWVPAIALIIAEHEHTRG
jgi:hypothetical protein